MARSSHYRSGLAKRARIHLQLFMAFSALALAPVAGQTITENGSAKMLACAYGASGSMMPSPLPSGFDWSLASAVVEINSPKKIENVGISDFTVFDETGKVLRLKRIKAVAVFDEPPYPSAGIPGKGSATYYAYPDRTRPWDGTLPTGVIRLWVSVALIEDPYSLNGAGNCRVIVGPHTIEGPADMWPAT